VILLALGRPATRQHGGSLVEVSCNTTVLDGLATGRWVSLVLQQSVTFVLAPLAGAGALQSMQQQHDLLWPSKNLCAAAQVLGACGLLLQFSYRYLCRINFAEMTNLTVVFRVFYLQRDKYLRVAMSH